MKRTLLATDLLISTVMCFAAPTTQNNIIGTYNCHGSDPVSHDHYQSKMTISVNPQSKSSYLVNERFINYGAPQDPGIGYVYDRHFVYMFNDSAYGMGVSAYKITNSGNLTDGQYMYFNHANKGFGAESCSKTSTT